MSASGGDDSTDSTVDDLDEFEDSPATDFGMKVGVLLALVAGAWAFVGPAHLLELGRYELPIVASVVEPLPYRFFAYVGGVTFTVALLGGVAYPNFSDEGTDEYAVDLAIGLIIPAVGLTLLLAVLGFLFPALFYAVGGDVVRAGLIIVGVVIIVVAAFLLRTIAVLVIAVWSAPLWLPAILGAGLGQILRGVAG